MASGERIETGLDLISELPVDLKERIFECLPTRDAARTALLSTHWKNVWLHHGRLAFDCDFIKWVRECKLYDAKTVTSIINNILLHRVGLVKKFTLHISCFDVQLLQSDIDRWCLFLSTNGVGELSIRSLCGPHLEYKLPFCIVSCHTIKHLKLQDFVIDLPVNGGCIFPAVTSLVLKHVYFKNNNVKGNVVYSIPKLEKLAFRRCDGIENVDISAPKLTSFSQLGSSSIPRWFTAHLEAIKYLCLSADLSETAKLAEAAPTARNLQVIKLYRFRFGCERHLKLAIQLLEKSPNLCTLEISAEKQEEWIDGKEGPSNFFDYPDIINKNLETLNTVKIEWFKGSRHEMLFLKALLSKSVALDKVVVQELRNRHNAWALINSRKLLNFPRASLKAQIVFIEYNFNYRLIGPP